MLSIANCISADGRLTLNLFWIKCRWTYLLGRDMVSAGVVSSSMVASQASQAVRGHKGRSVGSVQGVAGLPRHDICFPCSR